MIWSRVQRVERPKTAALPQEEILAPATDRAGGLFLSADAARRNSGSVYKGTWPWRGSTLISSGMSPRLMLPVSSSPWALLSSILETAYYWARLCRGRNNVKNSNEILATRVTNRKLLRFRLVTTVVLRVVVENKNNDIGRSVSRLLLCGLFLFVSNWLIRLDILQTVDEKNNISCRSR